MRILCVLLMLASSVGCMPLAVLAQGTTIDRQQAEIAQLRKELQEQAFWINQISQRADARTRTLEDRIRELERNGATPPVK
jgi:peptidoglycan hydrolase CwlO-like protein